MVNKSIVFMSFTQSARNHVEGKYLNGYKNIYQQTKQDLTTRLTAKEPMQTYRKRDVQCKSWHPTSAQKKEGTCIIENTVRQTTGNLKDYFPHCITKPFGSS